MPSLFTFRVKQPPEIGAMAKITLLHRVAYEKATPSSGLTSLGMKIRNRHVESCVYKKILKLQSSWLRIGLIYLTGPALDTQIYFAFYCGSPNLDNCLQNIFQLFEILLQNTGYNSAPGLKI
ncbi:hypothetical protein AVEN_272678-1 [Araneus ventricosus]|uniref:Uncharacterized protein n=1 Tax=Araneus ventricosus TaxID=182803 RepID=A0A4Y2R1K3_ARAVE|nr:hypothetical protein AVEN_34283-1 [Araneus ventricosus]GBN69547.1 hypothetical protein AVEN_272678-1 [Araneus ventricosus]